MDDSAPSMLKATLIGGASAGLVSALPVIGALNCLCCSLVISGGFFAAYLYSKDCRAAGAGFRPGSGAVVGLVAGLFYALASTAVSWVVRVIWPTDMEEIIEKFEELDLDPEVLDQAREFMGMFDSATGIVIMFLFTLLIAAVFSTVGGLIGGATFKVEEAPPSMPPTMM